MKIRVPSSSAVHGVLKEVSAGRADRPAHLLDLLAKPLLTGVDRWALWLALVLFRHERRQEWVGEVVEKRLGGNLGEIGQYGGSAYPKDRPTRGVAPGFPDWEYAFHGLGCRFAHRVHGEEIDVEFFGGRCDALSPAHFTRRLASLRRPELPEKMFQRPPGLQLAWQADLATLSQIGWVIRAMQIRLTDEARPALGVLLPLVDKLHQFNAQDDGQAKSRAAYLAAALGDAPLAWHLAKQVGAYWDDADDTLSRLQAQVERQITARAASLLERLGAAVKPTERAALLQALADLGRQAAEPHVNRWLNQPGDEPLADTALGVWAVWDDPAFDAKLVELAAAWRGLPPETRRARDRLCAKVLLRHRPPEALPGGALAALRVSLEELTAPEAFDAEAALLLHALDDHAALARLAAAVRGALPAAREEAAAALAVLRSPPAREALLTALDSGDVETTLPARVALGEFEDRVAWNRLSEWEARHLDHATPSPEQQAAAEQGKRRLLARVEQLAREFPALREAWQQS